MDKHRDDRQPEEELRTKEDWTRPELKHIGIDVTRSGIDATEDGTGPS